MFWQPAAGASPTAMADYRLSVRARSQLLDIYEFTAATFGQYQAEAYLAGLERTFVPPRGFPAHWAIS
jgi:toxin ParE1/3/4